MGNPVRWVGALVFLALSGCQAAPDAVNCIPIIRTTAGDSENGEIGGMVVPVEYQGRVSYLAVDTGSALTFLYLGRDGPEFRRRAGVVRIGDETLTLPGRSFDPDDETGIGIVGVLGADYLIGATALFDPLRATITRYLDRDAAAAAEAAFEHEAEVAFDNVRDHVIVRLSIDGRERRLMWDTGCPHLLLLGEEGREGDSKHYGEDIEGGRFPMFEGRATIELAGAARREVVALRAPRFPYFEGTVQALGGGIHGLAGQSVFGLRPLLFLPHRSVIRVGREDSGEGP